MAEQAKDSANIMARKNANLAIDPSIRWESHRRNWLKTFCPAHSLARDFEHKRVAGKVAIYMLLLSIYAML